MTITYNVASTVKITLPKGHTAAELRHKIEIALVQHGWPELEVVSAANGKFCYREMPEGEYLEETYE